MKFLLDVCAGGRLRTWLEGLGYDVVEVRSRDPFLSDEEVLAWAREEKRIVVTVDKDFGELAVNRGEVHCGIIRLPDVPFSERKTLMQHILSYHIADLETGSIITVSRTRIRVRRS